MILIMSNKWDITCDFVVMELRRRGQSFVRINTEDLPAARATVTLPDFHIYLKRDGICRDLAAEVKVIWNRRPGKPFDDVRAADRPSAATQKFVSDQWYSWLESLQLLRDVTWINHPQANDAMESKVRQLFLARKVGFEIPETWISNDPDAVRRGIAQAPRGLVVKALYSPLIEEPAGDSFIFTTPLRGIRKEDDTSITICPSIFQQMLEPKVDFRVTVVGDRVFAVKIEILEGDPNEVDWRVRKNGLRFTRCEIPASIEDLCRVYVKEAGLLFGAVDFVEHEGKFIFLEINPNGEWGWLQKPHNVPIAETLCDLMISRD